MLYTQEEKLLRTEVDQAKEIRGDLELKSRAFEQLKTDANAGINEAEEKKKENLEAYQLAEAAANQFLDDIVTAEKDVTTNYRMKDPYKRNMSSAGLSFLNTLGSIQVGNIDEPAAAGKYATSTLRNHYAINGVWIDPKNAVQKPLPKDYGFFTPRPSGPIRVWLRSLVVIPFLTLIDPVRKIWNDEDKADKDKTGVVSKLWNTVVTLLSGIPRTFFAWFATPFNFLSTPARSFHRYGVSLTNTHQYYIETAAEDPKDRATQSAKMSRKKALESEASEINDQEKIGYISKKDALAPGANLTKSALKRPGSMLFGGFLQLVNLCTLGPLKFVLDGVGFYLNNLGNVWSNGVELLKIESEQNKAKRALKFLDSLLRVAVPSLAIAGFVAASVLTGGILPFGPIFAAFPAATAAFFSLWAVGFLCFLHQNLVAKAIIPSVEKIAEGQAAHYKEEAQSLKAEKDAEANKEIGEKIKVLSSINQRAQPTEENIRFLDRQINRGQGELQALKPKKSEEGEIEMTEIPKNPNNPQPSKEELREGKYEGNEDPQKPKTPVDVAALGKSLSGAVLGAGNHPAQMGPSSPPVSDDNLTPSATPTAQ